MRLFWFVGLFFFFFAFRIWRSPNPTCQPYAAARARGDNHHPSGSGAGAGPSASINPPARPTASSHFGTVCGLRDLLLLLTPCRGVEGPLRPNSLHSRSLHPSVPPRRAGTRAAGKHPPLLQALPLAIKEKPQSAVLADVYRGPGVCIAATGPAWSRARARARPHGSTEVIFITRIPAR